MNALLDSICKAGLNRARIHDALANIEQYDGVTGHMVFDPNQKNVAPLYLGTVHSGSVTYRVASMEKPPAVGQTPLARHEVRAGNGSAPDSAKSTGHPSAAMAPYARVGEDGVGLTGPAKGDEPAGLLRVILFGPGAGAMAESPDVKAALGTDASRGQKWAILPVESGQSWGTASTQLVHALMDDRAIAIVALDREAGHLAEQLALKTFVPVIALSGDTSLTSTNVPWIFRLPAETTPGAAMRLLFATERRSGPNSGRLRDVLASGTDLTGVAFLPTGEPLRH